MRKDALRKLFAVVLVAAMVVGIMPRMQLFAASDDDPYDDPISGKTYQIPYDPDTTHYVARRTSSRFVGEGADSFFEMAGYTSNDYPNVRSASYSKITSAGYFYAGGTLIKSNGELLKNKTPGVATLWNYASPLVVEGVTRYYPETKGHGAYREVSSGKSHPGIRDPLDNEIFDLDRYSDPELNNGTNKNYGYDTLQKILAATFRRSSWFTSNKSKKTFTLWSGSDYAYELGKASDGNPLWYAGWTTDSSGKKRPNTLAGAVGSDNYDDATGAFISKSWKDLDAETQIKLPGLAQNSSSRFSGDTAEGIRKNNQQGVKNKIYVHYAKPVVFGTTCEYCFNEYYHNRGMDSKALITGGSGYNSGEVIKKGSASNNYTITVKRCAGCPNNESHKGDTPCYIWLVPGTVKIAATIYEDDSTGTFSSAAGEHRESYANNSNANDRYMSYVDVWAEGLSLPDVRTDLESGKNFKIKKDRKYRENNNSNTTRSFTADKTSETNREKICTFGSKHYNSDGDVNEYYQLAIYDVNVDPQPVKIEFYVNGSRTYTYHDSTGALKTVNMADFDVEKPQMFTAEMWTNKTPLSIGTKKDSFNKLPFPADAQVNWISYGSSGTLISADAYALDCNVNNPTAVILTKDTAGDSNKGGKIYDITASNIMPNHFGPVVMKVNITYPSSLVTINYLNVNDGSRLKDSVSFTFIKGEQGEIPFNISKNGVSYSYQSKTFGTGAEYKDSVSVAEPSQSNPNGHAKVTTSHNAVIEINTYYDIAGDKTLTMEYFIEGAAETEANYLIPAKSVPYKTGNELPYDPVITKNGKTYEFVRFNQNGVSDTYIKYDAANRKVSVIKNGKKNEKVKVYYRETAARTYTIHLVKSEAGKTLDQCSELYVSGKQTITGTTLSATLNTSNINQLSGYKLDTKTTPIDVHGGVRNNGSVTGSTNLTYTGGAVAGGYDYDIYIPYTPTITTSNKYTIHYMFAGGELWKEGPYAFDETDYTSGTPKKIRVTGSKTIGTTDYAIDFTNTNGYYDVHNYTAEHGMLGGTKNGAQYTTGSSIKRNYDYDIYIPLKIDVQYPEYYVHYYLGSTLNIVHSDYLGTMPAADAGKKKVVSWGGYVDGSELRVSFPSKLVSEGYQINYTGSGYDERNGIRQKGDLDGEKKTYTTRAAIEGQYRYDFYIPVFCITSGTLSIMYEYVDADNGYTPLWKEGVYIAGVPLQKQELKYIPDWYQLPEELPSQLSEMGWSLAGDMVGFVTTDPHESLYSKTYLDLYGRYQEEPDVRGGGHMYLSEIIEWKSMKIIIPLRNAAVSNKKVRIHYYVRSYERNFYSDWQYSENMPYYVLLDTYEFENASTGYNQFVLSKYYHLTNDIEDSTNTNFLPTNSVVEVKQIAYPTYLSNKWNGHYSSLYTLGGSDEYNFFSHGLKPKSSICVDCENYIMAHEGWMAGTMHHNIASEAPTLDNSATTVTVDDNNATFNVYVTSKDTVVDVYVRLDKRSGDSIATKLIYFEDGNPKNILYTDKASFSRYADLDKNIVGFRTGGQREYAYWDYYTVPMIVKDSSGNYWDPAYMQMTEYTVDCMYKDRAEDINYQNKYTNMGYGAYTYSETNTIYCRCGFQKSYYSAYQTAGNPISTYDWQQDHSYGKVSAKHYNSYINEIRVFEGEDAFMTYDPALEGWPVMDNYSESFWDYYYYYEPQSYAGYRGQWQSIILSRMNHLEIRRPGVDCYPIESGDLAGKKMTLCVKYDGPGSIVEDYTRYTEYESTRELGSRYDHTEPALGSSIAIYIPCKRSPANGIDVKYVTVDAAGNIDKEIATEPSVAVVRQGDTGFSYSGKLSLMGSDGRTYNVTGTGQVLAYKNANGGAIYKTALSDTSNTYGQPITYSTTGELGTWSATKPYQPSAATPTDGILYIPVAPVPDLTVKVRYVVYGETNTVVREDTLPSNLYTEQDIVISVPAELRNPTTNEALIPKGSEYNIALYGEETGTFFNVTYNTAESIRNGAVVSGYIYEDVLPFGADRVHITIPYNGYSKTDAVVYIPYEPSTTKVDVKYITIREDGTWRRTMKTEDEVELQRGNNWTYNGTRSFTKDGWRFEVLDTVEPVMSYNGASYDYVRGNPGTLGQRITYDRFATWTTTEKLNVERATLYIPIHIVGHDEAEGEERGTDPAIIPEGTDDYGTPGLTVEEKDRTNGLTWGNWCDDPLRPVPDRASGGLITGRDKVYAYIYHNTYSVSDAIPSGTNSVKGAINTFPFLAGATYSTVRKTYNYHIRNTVAFRYTYYTADNFDWSWTEDDVEDEAGFHKQFVGQINLPTIVEHSDTVTYQFGFDIAGESAPYVTDINLSVAALEGGSISDPALNQPLTIGKYNLGRTQKVNGSFTPQALSQYDYYTLRTKEFSRPVLSVRGGTYTNKDEFNAAVAQIKAFITSISNQPGEVANAANSAFAEATVNPAQAAASAAAGQTAPSHAQLWVDGVNYATGSGTVTPLSISRATYDCSNTASIPREKLNGKYTSTFTTDYRYYINDLGYPEVDPSGKANPVYVHTPIYTTVTVGCDNTQYEQTRQTGLPSFLLVNGTSDSYGSSGRQNITNDFTITVGNSGQHLSYPGYGNRDYSGYLMGYGNQIAFDCDMWMDVGNDGNPANDTLLPANTWAHVTTGSEANKGYFYLPEWVTDGTHKYSVRTVAYNNATASIPVNKIGAYAQTTVNTERTYDPTESGQVAAAHLTYVEGEFRVIGKMYGLTLTDVNDNNGWKNVFHATGKEVKLYKLLGQDEYNKRIGSAGSNTAKDGTGLSASAAFNKDLAYYYTFGTRNELGLDTGRMLWGSLPTLDGYNPLTRTEGTLKPGYTWTFRVDTVGTETVTDKALITVEPTFSWISLDGKTRVDNVKLYYSETDGKKKNVLTRVGSATDLANIKNTDVANLQIPQAEMKNTASIKGYGVAGGAKLSEYYDLEGTSYSYSMFTPSVNFKTFSNLNYYNDIKSRGIARQSLATGTLTDAIAGIGTTKDYLTRIYGSAANAKTELSKLKQSYYFNYRIPAEFYVYPVNKTASTLKDLKAEKMNDSGYLVVNFRLHSVVNGVDYLYYWDGHTNMWNLETGSTNGTIKRQDAAGTEFTLKNGDVALVKIEKDGSGNEIGTVLK